MGCCSSTKTKPLLSLDNEPYYEPNISCKTITHSCETDSSYILQKDEFCV